MTKGNLKIDIFLSGNKHATRSWHICPRVGEHIGIKVGDEDVICRVHRVVHMRPSAEAYDLGWQEIDIYVLPEETK